jgi:hypothetical protein
MGTLTMALLSTTQRSDTMKHSLSLTDRHDADHIPHHDHRGHHDQQSPEGGQSLNRVAWMATLHCLTGCAIGEVAGMVIGTALGLSNLETIALAILLAFMSGYAMTVLPLLRAGMKPAQAARLALAADTASIAVMEIVDNLVMLVVPGAMDAQLDSFLFWGSMTVALAIAAIAAFPLNRWLIARGMGHAVAHGHH